MGERIALLSSSYPRAVGDPAGHFVASEVAELTAQGHEVHVFAPGPPSNSASSASARIHWLEDRGCFGFPGALSRLHERPLRALGAAEFALRAASAVRRSGPYARVVAHFFLPCAWPILPLAANGTESLEVVGHGSDVRLFCALPTSLRGHIARQWLRRNVRLRVTSQELAARLERANPELAHALHVAASPLDMTDAPPRAAARAARGLDAAQRVALIVARLVPEKRVDSALRALSLLAEVSVIVVGDGPERERLSAAFPSVRFTGHLARPEALSFIAAADVLVSASLAEGAPTVVREARALGVPVVAREAGDLVAWAERDEQLWVVRR